MYMLAGLLFRRWNIFGQGSSMACALYAITMILYIQGTGALPSRNIKLDVRRITGLYGMTLLVLFFYKL